MISFLRTPARSATRFLTPVSHRLLQRKCACGRAPGPGGECDECRKKQLQRKATKLPPVNHASAAAPPVVHEVLRSPGQLLAAATRAFMEPRFGHDFAKVRVHTGSKATESARAVNALAFTVGSNIVFGAGQYRQETDAGRNLLAHELAHVVQQAGNESVPSRTEISGDSSAAERDADAAAEAALAGQPIQSVASAAPGIKRRAAPYIKKITVNLIPPQSASLEWEGTPPAEETGSDNFVVSTGKGYSDPGDPAGTCSRSCCSDPMTQCAPPWNKPDKVGACCTYYGNTFWTGTPLPEHNGWKWWTPVQPYYSARGIALHQHDEVTGQAIGHGCVRMAKPNAKRIYDFSNGRGTNVTIDGRAAPVLCETDRQCHPSASATSGAQREKPESTSLAAKSQEPVPGSEGELT